MKPFKEEEAEASVEPEFAYVEKCWIKGDERSQKSIFGQFDKSRRFDRLSAKLKRHRMRRAETANRRWLTKTMANYVHDDEIKIHADTDRRHIQSKDDETKTLSRLYIQHDPERSLWKSSAHALKQYVHDDEIRIRTSLIDMTIYIMYLVLLLLVVTLAYTPASYYLTAAIKKEFIDAKILNRGNILISFTEIKTPDEIFLYLTTHLKQSLFEKSKYMGDPSVKPYPEDSKNILYENRMIGLCRVQMVLVNEQSCYINALFEKYFGFCQNYYEPQYEYKSEFDGIKRYWKWMEGEGLPYEGQFGTYPPNGYIEDVGEDNSNAFEELEENRWITRQTRALLIHFTVYNANLNYFCNVVLAFEFPPTGGVYPSYLLRTVRLIPYDRSVGFFVLGFELALVVFLIYFAVEEVREFKFFSYLYFTMTWKYFDIMITLGLFFLVCLSLFREIYMKILLKRNIYDYISFELICASAVLFNQIMVMIVFLSWIKLFTFFDFTRILRKFKEAFSKCANDMEYFTLLTMFFFLAYAIMGNLTFGMGVDEYITVGESYRTLIRVVAGDVNFDTLHDFDNFFGPIYLMIFVIVIINVVLNLSVSILNEAYLQMKIHGLQHETHLTHYNYLKRAYYQILHRGKRRVNFSKYKERIKISYSDFVELLLRHSFTPIEIHAFFAKYNLKQYRTSHQLSPEHVAKIVQDIKTLDMQPYVPIDFFLQSANLLKKRFDEEHRNVLKIIERQSTSEKDFQDVMERLDELEVRLNMVCERLSNLRRYFRKEGIEIGFRTRDVDKM